MTANWTAGFALADITAYEPGLLTLGWGDLRGGIDGVDEPLQARALVLGVGDTRVGIVTLDLCFVSALLRDEIVARLDASADLHVPAHALLLTATHTHAGPSGISHHALYELGAPGIAPAVVATLADGVIRALRAACARLQPATLRYAELPVQPDQAMAYVREPRSHARFARRNPEASAMAMRVLRVDAADGVPLGLVSFFGLHGTCLHGENRRLHPDHPGLTARQLDVALGASSPEGTPFVALCAQESAGDVTPNHVPDEVRGVTRGRTPDDHAHVAEVAAAQAAVITTCWEAAAAEKSLAPRLGARLTLAQFGSRDFHTLEGRAVRTSPPTLGVGMLLGTREGRGPLAGLGPVHRGLLKIRRRFRPQDARVGVLDLRAGARRRVFELIPGSVAQRLPVEAMAQYALGHRAHAARWPWAPDQLPVQLLELGELRLAGIAAEPTLAAGHVIRQTLRRSPGCEHAVSVGYSNAYSSYVTTPEEYARQAYEGACTLYGPHTLDLWCAELHHLGEQLAAGTPQRAPVPRTSPPLDALTDRAAPPPYPQPSGANGLPRPLKHPASRRALRHYDTLVVGAGFSGLRVATRLQEAGQRVLLLEAHDRVGGRALTDEHGADLGCGFLAGYHTHAMGLMRSLGLDIIDFIAHNPSDPSFRRDTGERLDDMRLSETFFQIQGCKKAGPLSQRLDLLRMMIEWVMLENLVDQEAPWRGPLAARLDSITVADWMRGASDYADHRDLIQLGVAGVWSAFPPQLSLLYLLWYSATNGGMLNLCNDQVGGPQQFGVRGGLGGAARRFALTYQGAFEGSSPVHEVLRTERGFEVRARSGKAWSASQVVMATPPHATGRNVRFEPGLPAHLDRFLNQPTGHAVKAIVTYCDSWWRDQPEGRFYQFYAGAPGTFLDWALDASEPHRGVHRLCAFLNPAADPQDARPLQERFADAMLAVCGDPRCRDIARFSVKDWNADPYQGGGPVTLCGPGVLSKMTSFTADTPGLHFAGAEFSTQYTGYVEGALRSGERVAAQVLGQPVGRALRAPGPQWARFGAVAAGYAQVAAATKVLDRIERLDPSLLSRFLSPRS